MEFSKKNRLTIAEAKEIDMVDYLSSLGYEPSRIRGYNYWYSSPLHEEKTPSFKVNRQKNIWYDFGIGQGGSIIDFGQAYHKCSVAELLQLFAGNFQPPRRVTYLAETSKFKPEDDRVKILDVFEITSPALLAYLQKRKIPAALADRYCKEVRYELSGKVYYGIGFKNDSGGYEIRNAYYKTSSSPKDITTFLSGGEQVSVFEGSFDFLSYHVLHADKIKPGTDFVVLNSLSFFEKARKVLEEYPSINLYLDNDAPGQKCCQYAMSLSDRYKDQSELYKGHNDLNDFLTKIKTAAKDQRKGLRPH